MQKPKSKADLFSTASQEEWKRRIKSERNAVKEWECNWGFLKSEPAERDAPFVGEKLKATSMMQEIALKSSTQEAFRVWFDFPIF